MDFTHTSNTNKRSGKTLVVIPAYREAGRLPSFLKQLAAELESDQYAILVVDDGSPLGEQQKTAEIVESLRQRRKCVLSPLLLSQNQGKGAAIRAGWNTAKGDYDWLAFIDADGAISAKVAREFFEDAFHGGADRAYFGSRVKMLGKEVQRSSLRHASGRMFAHMVGLWISPDVYDSQCGVKILPRAVYERIKGFLSEDGFSFDIELLAALLHTHTCIQEIPIDWKDIGGSKVSLFKDTLRMLAALKRISHRRSQWT